MKRYFGIIVAIVFVVVAIVFVMRKWDEATQKNNLEQAQLKLRGDYLERVAWLRVNPDEKAYKSEVDTFLRWYFKEVTDLLNKHGGNREHNDYLLELEERANKKKDDKFDQKKAVYEYTRAIFDKMKAGQYAPYWTSTNSGVRLDILSASVQNFGGEAKIHMPVVVWGLPREDRTDDKNIRKVTTNGAFRFTWKITDEKGKLIAEIPGEGGPDSRVDWPDRYVKYFPPGMLLGHYDVDKLPAESKNVEINFTISSRAVTGGDIMASYEWKLEVPAEWKMQPGETWQGAQESVRPEEEINPGAPVR